MHSKVGMDRGRIVGLFLVGVATGCFAPDNGSRMETDASSSGTSSSSTQTETGSESSTGPGGGSSMSNTESSTTGAPTETETQTQTETSEDESTSTGTTALPCPSGEGLPDPVCTDPSAPFCLDGSCVGCVDLEPDGCAAIDPAQPTCLASGACGVCAAHGDCGSGACRFATGECISAESTIRVDVGADCGAGDGSEASPFCTLLEATQLIGSQPPGAWAIFLAPGTYNASVSATATHPIAVIGPPGGALPTVESLTVSTFFTGAGELYLSRIHASDNDSAGSAVVQNGGFLRLDDVTLDAGDTVLDLDSGQSELNRVIIASDALLGVRVGANATTVLDEVTIEFNLGAMHIEGGDVTMRRSTVSNNYVDGGIFVDGGTLRLENSILHSNGYVRGAVQAASGVVDVLYSTIVDTFECGSSQVTVRNSVVVGFDLCGTADIDMSAVDPGYQFAGEGNIPLDPADLADHFVSPGTDFHLLPGSEIAGLALWQATDPAIDFDGDARPTIALSTDAAGADVP